MEDLNFEFRMNHPENEGVKTSHHPTGFLEILKRQNLWCFTVEQQLTVTVAELLLQISTDQPE